MSAQSVSTTSLFNAFMNSSKSTSNSSHGRPLEQEPTPEGNHLLSGNASLAAPLTHSSAPLSEDSNWSESLQLVLNQPPAKLPQQLLLAGIAFVGMFGAWAWFGQIQNVSYAQGRLIPKGEVYRVQPVVQGEISAILVKEGQQVRAGQAIAKQDSQLAEAEIERLEQSLNATQIQLLQVQGLIDRTRLEWQTQQAIAKANVAAQQAAITEVIARVTTLEQLLAQFQTEMAAHEARLARLRPFVEEGVLPEEHLFEVEQAWRDRQQALTQNRGELQQAMAQSEQYQAKLIQIQAEGRKSDLGAQQQLQQLELEAAELQAKINDASALLKESKTRQEQLLLRAPVSGLVSSLNLHNIGEVAQPGQTIMEIAPAATPLVLSAVLPSQEAGLVEEGLPVQMKFDAFPYQDFGLVSGKVLAISPDAKLDEKLGAVYRVEISLDQPFITRHQSIFPLKAGQTATAEIVTRQRRIADILLDPIRQLQTGGISL